MKRKKVIVIENGVEFKFRSMTEAGKFLGMEQSALSRILSDTGIGSFFIIKEDKDEVNK